jgi:hypothetical protein
MAGATLELDTRQSKNANPLFIFQSISPPRGASEIYTVVVAGSQDLTQKMTFDQRPPSEAGTPRPFYEISALAGSYYFGGSFAMSCFTFSVWYYRADDTPFPQVYQKHKAR